MLNLNSINVRVTSVIAVALLSIAAVSTTDWIKGIRNKPFIDVREYGADPTGVTSSTTACNNAATAAGAGGTIVFPAGTYLMTDACAPVLSKVAGVYRKTRVIGAGIDSTRIMVSASFNMSAIGVFDCHQTVLYTEGCEISGLSILYIQPDSASIGSYTHWPPAINLNGSAWSIVRDVRIYDAWDGISMLGTFVSYSYFPDASAITLDGVQVTAYHKAILQDGSWDTIRIHNMHCQASFNAIDASPTTIVNKTAVYYANATCLSLGHGDDIKISDSLLGGKVAIDGEPGAISGGPSTEIDNTWFDGGAVLLWNADRPLKVTNCDFEGGTPYTDQVLATRGQVQISNSRFSGGSTTASFVHYHPNADLFPDPSLTLDGNVFTQTGGVSGSPPLVFIDADAGSNAAVVVGHNILRFLTASGAAVFSNAVLTINLNSAAWINAIVENNVFQGDVNTRSWLSINRAGPPLVVTGNITNGLAITLPSASWAGVEVLIAGNPGYNPVGPATQSTGGSPWGYTAGPTPEILYLSGAATLSVVKRGVTVCTAVPCSIWLSPGDNVVSTYTGTLVAAKDIQ